MRKLIKNQQGFTLIEIMIVLMVLSILGAALASPTLKIINDAKEDATKKEMEILYKTIYGNPDEGNYGYVGDMGDIPGSLDDFNTQPVGAEDYTSSGRVNGVGIGWNGPYLNFGYSVEDYLQDAWGRDYLYDDATGQITSLGADGVEGTNDDLVYPSGAVDTKGELSITVTAYDNSNGVLRKLDSADVDVVTVYYSDNGTEASEIFTWNATAQVFTDPDVDEADRLIHYGVHAVTVTGKGDCVGLSASSSTVVLRGTTSLTVFLGYY